MSNRYVSLILECDETEAKELTGAAEAVASVLRSQGSTAAVVATWLTDYKPLDPTAETRHLLQLRPDSWVLEHPMSCRAQAPLDTCPIFQACEHSVALADGAAYRRLGIGWYAVTTNKTGGLHFNLQKVDR